MASEANFVDLRLSLQRSFQTCCYSFCLTCIILICCCTTVVLSQRTGSGVLGSFGVNSYRGFPNPTFSGFTSRSACEKVPPCCLCGCAQNLVQSSHYYIWLSRCFNLASPVSCAVQSIAVYTHVAGLHISYGYDLVLAVVGRLESCWGSAVVVSVCLSVCPWTIVV